MGKGNTSADFTATQQPAGIYGWRKQCLYATILFIVVVVIMNLAVTVWILRVFNFTIDGLHMGTVRITSEGVFIGGKVDIAKTLYTSKIMNSKKGKPLRIKSNKDVLLNAGGTTNERKSSLHIGRKTVELTCDEFVVKDYDGRHKLKVTDREIQYGMDEIRYGGKAVFNGSVETPNIRGPYKGSLSLESASSSIIVSGNETVLLEAPEGKIEIKSSGSMLFQSNKKITLNANNIYMKNIYTSSPNNGGKTYDDVYQLCLCKNGRLFLAPSSGRCVTDNAMCS